MMSVGTIRMGMGRGHLLGYGLDGDGNCDLSRDRSHFPFPWKYRGKSTAGIFPRGALIIYPVGIGERKTVETERPLHDYGIHHTKHPASLRYKEARTAESRDTYMYGTRAARRYVCCCMSFLVDGC